RRAKEDEEQIPTAAPSGVPLARGSAFQGVRGQDPAVGILRAALRHGRVAHAWLFTGPTGVGRELTARRLAAALLCTGRTADMPADEVCGTCSACARVDRGLHPDVRVWLSEAEAVRRGLISWTEERKPSVELKVEQVRELRDSLRMTAFEGGWRVAIIPQAERMRVEAGNALLKTLEEPLPRSLIILCAPDRRSVMETLRSRCQRVSFAPLPPEIIAQILAARRELPPEQALVVARQSEGSVARAMAAEPGSAERSWERAEARLALLTSDPPGELLDLAEQMEKDKDDLESQVRMLARVALHQAEALLQSAGKDGVSARRARHLALVAGGALALQAELLRPGVNVRLTLERFLLSHRPGVQGLT
ncbi:MAG: DNA polymerase III subunit delta', partial [Myxococcota bacterium]